MDLILYFVLGTIFSAICLWIGMKLTRVQGDFVAILAISGLSSLAEIIPKLGGLISVIVMFYLICKWTDAKLLPDAVLMVLVAKLVSILGAFALLGSYGI